MHFTKLNQAVVDLTQIYPKYIPKQKEEYSDMDKEKEWYNMKKSSAKQMALALLSVIVLLLLFPGNTYSAGQDIPALEAEMDSLVDILAHMDNGTLNHSRNIYYGKPGVIL